ncbi:ATP-grasp domain-containing protein [Microbacterium sp. 77mftsu3.1]|uniref:ATP-grasp domain-containing protein n=1 Tax=Microbacterium sp. 77mftsu3.1 TaxID=1761802 RepID=UPI000380C92A|nr:ATP-grasp domain-containing protein [Microbacterium sp. 77mftsu3.1]SDH53756.1 hypothetical protein SAMN04488590_3511 [Microbacterium sp. 77mftsu3.1]
MRNNLHDKERLRDLQAIDRRGSSRAPRATMSLREEWLWTAGLVTFDKSTGNLIPTERGEAILDDTGEREWLYSVRPVTPKTPVPRFSSLSHAVWDYERRLGKLPDASDDGDDEVFREEIARFRALLSIVDNDRIWINRSGGRPIVNLITGEEFAGERDELFEWGMRSNQDTALHPLAAEQKADSYFTHHIGFTEQCAGRKIVHADATLDSLTDALRRVAEVSERAFIKGTRLKSGITTLDLTGVTDYEDYEALILSDPFLAGELMYRDGDRWAFLVQEWVDMTFERRFFIVDGITVAHAGCIEEYTPFDHLKGVEDCRMKRHRSDTDILWAAAETKLLGDFARQVGKGIYDRDKAMSEFVLDVAIGPDGQPLIVELNGIRNAGLYASSPGRVIDLLARRRDVWSKAPHARPRRKVQAT